MTPDSLSGEGAGTLLLSRGINMAHSEVLQDLMHVFVMKHWLKTALICRRENITLLLRSINVHTQNLQSIKNEHNMLCIRFHCKLSFKSSLRALSCGEVIQTLLSWETKASYGSVRCHGQSGWWDGCPAGHPSWCNAPFQRRSPHHPPTKAKLWSGL